MLTSSTRTIVIIAVLAFETGVRRRRSPLKGVDPRAALGDRWVRSIVPKGRG